MAVQPGETLAHYRIERLIGQGGMGAVYLAEDTKLRRKVALKVLPAELSSDADRLARFQREARVVAALNHPHIVTLHSVEQAGCIHFLTMELVEGQSLDRFVPNGGLPLTKLFELGIALADAMAAAHEKGIVHRDLKPANVMVTRDGRVKVLDFGLAKLAREPVEDEPGAGVIPQSAGATLTASPDGSLTGPGRVVGTVPYMSPEQVNGQALDARTDIFSLGVVLYEMATGRRPFGGRTSAETMSSILRDAPRPVTETREDTPRHLARIIDHCLQKDPEARFQTAKDVRNELRALSKELEAGTVAGALAKSDTGLLPNPASGSMRTRGGSTSSRAGLGIGLAVVGVLVLGGLLLYRGRGQETRRQPVAPAETAEDPGVGPDPKSIAVLPFVDMSQSRDQDYFSDGISEELLNLLARVPQLKVMARTSSFSFKGREVEIPEIARQLRVAHVLEGSVRRAGDRVRITAQLVHAPDGFQLWSESYDRKLDDIFAIQEEIAADVVKELRVTLLGAVPAPRTTDARAYALYLQAVQLGRQYTAQAFAQSDTLYRQVLAIDPRYAPAWDELARNSVNEASNAIGANEESYARAREAAERALAIDPDYAPAHARLGLIALDSDLDFAAAARHYQRALALDPTDLEVLRSTDLFLQHLGRQEQALALGELIVRRDPVNVMALTVLGQAQLFAGQYDAAIATFRTGLSLNPGGGIEHYRIGKALLLKGDAAGALRELEQEPSEVWRLNGLSMAYHALGRSADADTALDTLIAMDEREAAYNIAYAYAFRGEVDKAFAWLDKAVDYRDPGLADLVTEHLFDNIVSDPRWLPLLRKLGKAPEQLAEIKLEIRLPE